MKKKIKLLTKYIRKVWNINPKTKVKPNKKNKILEELKKKEINEY